LIGLPKLKEGTGLGCVRGPEGAKTAEWKTPGATAYGACATNGKYATCAGFGRFLRKASFNLSTGTSENEGIGVEEELLSPLVVSDPDEDSFICVAVYWEAAAALFPNQGWREARDHVLSLGPF
jgi:hypothetical protein